MENENVFRISGVVIDLKTRRGVKGLRVEAWDNDRAYNDLVGSTVTDEQGAFQMKFDDSYFQELFQDSRPDLFFRVFREGALIKSTEDSVLWNVESGPTKITIEIDVPAIEEPAPPLPLSVTGTVINAKNGFPLRDLRVAAYFVEPISQKDEDDCESLSPKECLLGEGETDASGRFDVVFRSTRSVRQRLHLLTSITDVALQLKVFGPKGQQYYASEPLSALSGNIHVTLPVTLPESPVTSSTWEILGARLEDARITQIHELVRQLAFAIPNQSLFDDWSLETRQAVLIELEQAFLDPQGMLRTAVSPLLGFQEMRIPGALEFYSQRLKPHLGDEGVQKAFADMVGKIQSFTDLTAVDWIMDLNGFRNGDPGTAMDWFSDDFRIRPGIDAPPALGDRFRETTLSQYRDYLLAVWAGFITKVELLRGQVLNRDQALEQLANRFHQDFTTGDITPQPANELMISLVRNILLHPTGSGFGFGLTPAGIPARGQLLAREYLDKLIGLSGLSAREFGLRYRIDLGRPDSILSNPVQENIATLQGFFRDSFQCHPEPFPVKPDVLHQPIIPSVLQGKAPFFLHYEEWLRKQTPFYAENYYNIRGEISKGLFVGFTKEHRDDIHDYATDSRNVSQNPQLVGDEKTRWLKGWAFIEQMIGLQELLDKGHTQFELSQFPSAKLTYQQALDSAGDLLTRNDVIRFHDLRTELLLRKQTFPNPKDINELKQLERYFRFNPFARYNGTQAGEITRLNNSRQAIEDKLVLLLAHYVLYVLPTCLGDTALALGDYETAVLRYQEAVLLQVGIAKASDGGGYVGTFRLFAAGELPYTVNLKKGDFHGAFLYIPQVIEERWSPIEGWQLVQNYTHPMEEKFFRFRQGNAMLEWADSLYRTDDPSSIARARELYKGVLWLHGEAPPICPKWPKDSATGGLGSVLDTDVRFGNFHENPALRLQKARARLGFFKIEAGLNYFGERNDVVPALRYRPLKEYADRFAALAKATQQEFLLYIEKVESTIIERMKLSNLLQKASLQASVADQQIEIAKYQQSVAEQQVADVEAAIAAKIKEIQDADSFFSQFGDFVGGLVKTFTSLPDDTKDTKSATAAGYVSEVTGKEMVGSGMLGGGAGASIMTGFGVFFVASYMSMSSMVEASNRRANDLNTLRDKALPAAQALVGSRKREVTIAGYMRQIAQADIDLARDLITFEENRFLNLNFWTDLAQIARRILARYLDLGARVSWLAERALVFELDRDIRIVRFDYFPEKLQGVTGANLLEADLAELEAIRIEGIKSTVPVRHTFSLLRDFPLQFGQLKRTGACAFRTEELPMRIAYPGTAAYRIRAVSISVTQADFGNPLRGLLLNQGISISRPGQPEEHVLVRSSEAMPLSEFRLQNDMAVYSLPDETLLTFEGSSIETFWELQFPKAANVNGLDGLADVLLTFDLRALYFPDLYPKQLASMPTAIRRWVLLSAARLQAQAVKNLAGTAASVTFEYDLSKVGLPKNEANRKVKNLALFIVSEPALNVRVDVSSAQPSQNVPVQLKQGIATSNMPPAPVSPPPTPQALDKFLDFEVRQRFSVLVNKAQNTGVDFSGVSDVLLAVEYAANLK